MLARARTLDDRADLGRFALQAVRWLCNGDYDLLSRTYGYAVALGREQAVAIAEDLRASLSDVGATSISNDQTPEVKVKWFGPGEILVAAVECALRADNGRQVLVDLVVTRADGREFITLEHIGAATL